jgi:hypothetical protein
MSDTDIRDLEEAEGSDEHKAELLKLKVEGIKETDRILLNRLKSAGIPLVELLEILGLNEVKKSEIGDFLTLDKILELDKHEITSISEKLGIPPNSPEYETLLYGFKYISDIEQDDLVEDEPLFA